MLSIKKESVLSGVSGLISRMTLAERIQEALDGSGLSKAEFARAAKISSAAVSQWLSGETKSLKLPSALGLEARTGYRAEWLSEGKLPKKFTTKEIDLDGNSEYPAIRRLALKAQAGVTGYAVDYLDNDGPPIVFRKDWYSAHNYQPDKMLAMRVSGESMVPSLYADDLIVINTMQTEPKDGIAFVISYEGEITVKRLVRDVGQWWLTSDNPDQRRYPRKACDDATQVIGEVIYRQTERI